MLAKTEESETINMMEIWEKYVLVRRDSKCKGPEVKVCLENSKNSKEGRVAGVEGLEDGEGLGDEVKVNRGLINRVLKVIVKIRILG